MTAEEFDKRLHALVDEFATTALAMKAKLEANMEVILQEAAGAEIPPHLLMASITSASKKLADLK